ncbi:hypothetical protein PBY51_010803 [Eleginops maclovinus]|uniref:Uncharacterized protein n=1 Tax=Eleginops maclovinus TaxID=56733 RepID=A0AAN7XB97_ELEMC|nr:hypothetical protein PBY51_010803 [Eleginops maclovinus]
MESATERRCLELIPHGRGGHMAVVEKNLLYVWGGLKSVAGGNAYVASDEILVNDFERGLWNLFNMLGTVPPVMSGTCSCSLDGHMYIFGGCSFFGENNQIYCVDLMDSNYKWREIIPETGSPPSPRDKLSCWVYKGKIIYFGGYGEKALEDFDTRNNSFIVDTASWVTNDLSP